ncbi:hypothetical protein I2I05_00080 [Hymenobacter sp. BT683]|uniref:Glycosyltransferase RgtA/B/C/D-like domain-containing protein n=1 Tax=Hymenobacter jeongseonensis TaxID=2791027 RepID=A0ABS0IBT5_9BACT|nr:hypothetical protein [Hymenobacter jeongseonensis]MBF9235780.1 hypothetical protein [Hymenobacter jeongseonensis]
MLRFFKSSLPAQLLALLLLVLALRLPLLWLGLPVTAAELRALLVGERLHGGAMPYRDLFDGTAPLAAATFAVLDAVVSRPVWLYRVFALALLLVQALRLNLVFNRYDVHPERGYVAALTYLLIGSVSTDLDTLSPLLLGHTFIVFALSALLPTSREGYDNRRLFRAGFLIGVAALCYLPLSLFVIVGLFAVVIFAANSFRSSLLLLCGFFFPYALLATFFFYFGAMPGFVQFHLQPGLTDLIASGLPAGLQLRLLVVPGIVLLLGLLRSLGTSLGLVFQVKFRQMMLVWLAIGVATAAVEQGAAPGVLVLLLPPLAYFSLFLWQRYQHNWLLELGLLLILNAAVVLRYRAHVPRLEALLHMPAESRFGLQPDPRYASLRNQTLLILGQDDRAYFHNRPATPYLDWALSQVDFGHLSEYAAAVRISQRIGPTPPAYLLDQVSIVPRLKQLLPSIFASYEPTGTPGLYRRR